MRERGDGEDHECCSSCLSQAGLTLAWVVAGMILPELSMSSMSSRRRRRAGVVVPTQGYSCRESRREQVGRLFLLQTMPPTTPAELALLWIPGMIPPELLTVAEVNDQESLAPESVEYQSAPTQGSSDRPGTTEQMAVLTEMT